MNSSKATTPAPGGGAGKGRVVSAPGAAAVRYALLRLVVGNDLFTPAEQQQADESAAACREVAPLAAWLADARRTAAERAAGPAHEQQRAEIRRLLAHPSVATAYMKAKLARLLESGTYAEANRTLPTLTRRAAWADANAKKELLPLPEARRQDMISRRGVANPGGSYYCPNFPLPARQWAQVVKHLRKTDPVIGQSSSRLIGGKEAVIFMAWNN